MGLVNTPPPILKSLKLTNFLSFGREEQAIDLRPLNVLIGPNGSGKSNLGEALGILREAPRNLEAAVRQGGGVREWLWKGTWQEEFKKIEAVTDALQEAFDGLTAREGEVLRLRYSLDNGRARTVEETGDIFGLTAEDVRQIEASALRKLRPGKEHIFSELLHRGREHGEPVATIETTVNFNGGNSPLRYRLSFTAVGQRLEVVDERVEDERPPEGEARPGVYFGYENGWPVFNVRGRTRKTKPEDLNPRQSVLAQRKDPESYPQLTYLGNLFSRLRLFTEWNLGRRAAVRSPQSADLPGDFLSEDAANLALVLSDLEQHRDVRKTIRDQLEKFCPSIEDFSIKVYGGTVQLFIHEKGLREPVPASRLSDGTLRFLCLLAILCHPEPPPLIWLEEPELGLHPDIIPVLADLLLEASSRTQLLVTTHSDILVDALSEHPESILVCERGPEGTSLRRLEQKALKDWLERYSLGELWLKGEIGGTRW